MSQLDCGFGEACQSVKRVLCGWTGIQPFQKKYPNYSETRPCKCHLTYTQLLFYLTALHWFSTQPHIETQANKSLRQFMYAGLCTNTHTHNLSKHTYSHANNYCTWRGGTHTHRQTHCHACRKNNNCLWWHQCYNTPQSSLIVVYSTESLRALWGIGWPSSLRWFVT